MSLLGIIIVIGIVLGMFGLLPLIGQTLRTIAHNPLITLGVLTAIAVVVAFMSGVL